MCIAPSSERWSWCCVGIPLSEEVDCGCLAKGLPLLCEVVFVVALYLASSERLFLVERTVVYSILYLPQILSGGSLCGSPVWTSGLEILLCEGGDVELCARTLKHIRVFVFDRLTLTLSLYFVHCFTIAISYTCLSVCVPHLCLTTRASYSTSTLIQRNQEELVQSPSRGIQLHSLVALSVVAIKF